MHPTGKKYFSVSRNKSTGSDISISSVLKVRDMETISRYTVSYGIAWYGTWYHDMSRSIIRYRTTPDHLETPGTNKSNFNEKYHLVAVYSSFFRLCLCPHLARVRLAFFLLSSCCPSAGHIIRLTVSPSNSNLVPLGLGLLPERMRVCFVSFFIFFISFLSLPLFFPSWYLVHGILLIVVARYLIYYCC